MEIYVQPVSLIKINFLLAQVVIVKTLYKRVIEIQDGFVIIVILTPPGVEDIDAILMIMIYAMIVTIIIFSNLIAKILVLIVKEL